MESRNLLNLVTSGIDRSQEANARGSQDKKTSSINRSHKVARESKAYRSSCGDCCW